MIAPTTVAGLLARLAEVSPDAPMLLAPDRLPLTCREAWSCARTIAGQLQQRGLCPGDRVAVVLPNGSEMAMAFLCVAAITTCTPLNPAYRAEEFAFYLEDLNAKAILLAADDASPTREAAGQLGIPCIDVEVESGAPAGAFHLRDSLAPASPPILAGPDDVALILHTSGTTARPKMVPLTQANLCASAAHIVASLALSPADRCLNVMPLFHIHGLLGALLSSLTAGGSVICTSGFSAPDFFTWVDACCPTWYTAVPTMHQAILTRAAAHHDIIAKHPFRFIRSCSAPLPPAVMAQLEHAFSTPVVEAYGMTEASHQIACNPLPPLSRKAGSVGIPTGTQIAVMDAAGTLLPAGRQGEVVIQGHAVTAGYAGNPEANTQAFAHGWFHTGDQGYLDEEGYLFLTGRLKELINRGGEKIAPREIDDVLLEHAAVKGALAFALPHPQLGETVAAAVVLQEGASVGEWELQDFVATRLADFKVPARIVLVEDLPKGPTGKPQRIGLAERLGLSSPADDPHRPPFVAPRTESEAWLASLWQEALDLPAVGIHDNFFALGGESLRAAHVLARMQARLTVDFTLHHFFAMPTIAEQASWLEENDFPPDASDGIDDLLEELSQLAPDERQRIMREL